MKIHKNQPGGSIDWMDVHQSQVTSHQVPENFEIWLHCTPRQLEDGEVSTLHHLWHYLRLFLSPVIRSAMFDL